MSFVKIVRFLADFHFAMAQGYELALNIIDPDGPKVEDPK